MIRVGFLLTIPKEYKGGINYFVNLFFAAHQVKGDDIELYIFVPSEIPEEYIKLFAPYCTVIRTKIVQRKTLPWFIDKVAEKLTGRRILSDNLLRKYNIDLLSHSYYVPRLSKVKTINWIPDFQYIHYPNLWTQRDIDYVTKMHRRLAQDSDRLLLSSNDAANDYKSVYPVDLEHKIAVVHFVSQPQQPLTESDLNHSRDRVRPYVADDMPYFYLPNQFWKHKNHICAFKAAKSLKEKGYRFQLFTSGHMKDFRGDNTHVDSLIQYVKDNDLEDVVKFLGLIPYNDVFYMIINANALINPSYFEGWSSTVEEAKSVGTLTLLSSLPVHIEQDPLQARYFNPDKAEELEQLMEDVLTGKIVYQRPSVDFLKEQLQTRTLDFGRKYTNLIRKVMSGN